MSWSSRYAVRGAGLVVLAGVLNLLPITLPGGGRGSLAAFVYMPLVLLLPLRWAVLAAAIPMAVTLWMLNHPFLLGVVSLEALWLAWWLQRGGRLVLLADFAFWAALGGPVLFLCYWGVAGIPAVSALLVASEEIGVQILAVAFAAMFVRHSQLGHWLAGREPEPARVGGVLVHAVFVLALVPLALVGVGAAITIRSYLEEQNRAVLTTTANRISQQMTFFLGHHESVVQNVAQVISRGADAAIQIEETKRSHLEFITMLVTDAEGTIRATAPAAALATVGGSSVRDREYFQAARSELKSFVSGVFRGRGFGNDLLIAVSAPILDREGRFAGIVQASLEVQTFARHIAEDAGKGEWELLLADRYGRIIFSDAMAGVPPLTQLGFLPQAALLDLADGESLYFDKLNAEGRGVPYVAYAVRADQGRAIAIVQRPLLADLHHTTWLLWLYGGVAIAVTGAVVWVASNVRRQMVLPLEQFAREATRQAELNTVAELPKVVNAPYEVGKAYDAFNQLARRLQGTYQLLRQHNQELDRKVTERTREAEIAREQAEAANRSKSDFLAMTSHEIRTPLNAMLGIAAALDEKTFDPRSLDFLRTIRVSGLRLLNIVNDVLDISRAEAGKLELHLVPVELGALVAEVEQLFRLRAQNQGIALRVDINGPSPGWFQGDPLRLQQVLINLVGNALKFTSQGMVTLAVGVKADGGRLTLDFAVRDTGPGIPPDQQARLFEPYVQLAGPAISRTPGTGLGLTISRRLVALLGGELLLRSEVGRGSEFYFSIQVDRAESPVAAPAAPQPLRVLAADDNLGNQEVIRLFLAPHCGRLDIVGTVAEAMERLGADDYDVALIDLEMPDGDGFSIAEAVRSGRMLRASTCVLVAISAHSRGDVWPRCAASGFDAYVGKPIDRRALLELVRGAQAPVAGGAARASIPVVP